LAEPCLAPNPSKLDLAAVRACEAGQDAEKERSGALRTGDQQEPSARTDGKLHTIEHPGAADSLAQSTAGHCGRLKEADGAR